MNYIIESTTRHADLILQMYRYCDWTPHIGPLKGKQVFPERRNHIRAFESPEYLGESVATIIKGLVELADGYRLRQAGAIGRDDQLGEAWKLAIKSTMVLLLGERGRLIPVLLQSLLLSMLELEGMKP